MAELLISTPPRIQWPIVGSAIALALAGAAVQAQGWRNAALWGVGIALGYALYQATFGFSAGYRALLRDGRTAHVRAQFLMLAAAAAAFLPALEAGAVFGHPVRGFVFPAGLAVAVGAFMFGVGMQLGGGCASGTLYTVGGGSTRMLITLLFIVAGATSAAQHAELWNDLPTLPLLALYAATFVLLWLLALGHERRRHGTAVSIWRQTSAQQVWPFAWAALALAVLNFATLLLAGRPWGITQAFALWGSKTLDRTGLADPVFWAFWEQPTRAEALYRPLWTDTTSMMDVAVVVGALLAAGLAGRFSPQWRIAPPHLLASVIGGLLLGAGAIVATGCNISAMFSGIASGSLHGWLWIAAALPGNWLGVHLRPLFGLDDTPVGRRAIRDSV